MKVYFGKAGTADHVEVVKSSGAVVFDAKIADWIQRRWYEPAYAGKVEVIPFDFKPSAATVPASAGPAGG